MVRATIGIALRLSIAGILLVLLAEGIGRLNTSPDVVAVPAYDFSYNLLLMDMERRVTYRVGQDVLMSTSIDIHPHDSQKIAYTDTSDGNSDIYVMDVLTQHKDRITQLPSSESQPKWSPDGRWIAFISNRNGFDNLFAVHPEGGAPRQLTNIRFYLMDAD
jgi:TolB protein